MFQVGNRSAFNTGEHSPQFWRDAHGQRASIRRDTLRQFGHADEAAAPRTLFTAADALAQSSILRDAAFARIVEAGGPLTTADRARRAFAVWEAACGAVERNLRLLGRAKATAGPNAPDLSTWLEDGDDADAAQTSAHTKDRDDE